MDKVRRRRRHSSDSSSDYTSDASYYDRYYDYERSVTPEEDQMDYVFEPEPETNPETLPEVNVQDTVPPTEQQPEPATDITAETVLDPNILNILGDEPAKEDSFGPEIHEDLASRWSDILINGLKADTKSEILKGNEIPENLKLSQPPILNPEIKAAVQENVIKRDSILADKQKLLGCVITCVANTMTNILSSEKEIHNDKTYLKDLSNAGRLLCHIHHTETQARRNFLLACLNKDVKDNIKNTKRDQMLFGADLPEKLKSMKAISKTGAELKSVVSKAKPQPKGKQTEASTSRALNWRGPPPPPPPPRRGTARMSSTAGGRKQQTTRRYPDRHGTRHQNNRTQRR
ncbi:hypothetical protein NE865_09893 [Phthorimaea operculella]|nr:hypothetical protein NE865_09893 [Phthorimaea operculella]